MQREINDKVTLGNTLNPYEDVCRSSAVDRTVSNYNDAKEKVQKIKELISTGRYDKFDKIYPQAPRVGFSRYA